MANPKFNISTVAPHLCQPIADLVGRLIGRRYVGGNWISTNFYESGYAASALLLICALLESMIQRDRYFLLREKPRTRCESAIANYARRSLKYRRYRHLRELFDVRNAIAHNHMWEISYTLKPGGGEQHRSSRLVPGTHQLSTPPDPANRVPRTKLVRLHLMPSTIDRTDVVKALNVSIHFLDHLAAKGTNPVNMADDTFGVNGQRHAFRNLPNLLQETTQ